MAGGATAACGAHASVESSTRLAVWHDTPVPGGVRVYVDSAYIGTLRRYVERGPPQCASRGTLTVRVAPAASVRVTAAASDGRQWRHTMKLVAGRCTVLLLSGRTDSATRPHFLQTAAAVPVTFVAHPDARDAAGTTIFSPTQD